MALTRNVDDRIHVRQVSVWETRADFERYWFSPELVRLREQALNYFNKPVLPSWHTVAATASAEEAQAAPTEEPAETTA